jgi:recombination associated protein RdgC
MNAKIDTSSLGRDFLTWLWFKSEERNGSVMLPGVGDIEIIFMQRVIFESGEGEFSETVVCQGLHSSLKEGKVALGEGKKVREARLKLGIGSDQWEFTFKADDFRFQSLKLPQNMADEEEDCSDGSILERIYMIERAIETMERLFSLFLKKRMMPEWTSEEMPRIDRWIKK